MRLLLQGYMIIWTPIFIHKMMNFGVSHMVKCKRVNHQCQVDPESVAGQAGKRPRCSHSPRKLGCVQRKQTRLYQLVYEASVNKASYLHDQKFVLILPVKDATLLCTGPLNWICRTVVQPRCFLYRYNLHVKKWHNSISYSPSFNIIA